jgi:hypothetical protein
MFYIAKKTQFEQIVGLDAEFKEQSKDVVCELEKVNMIEGLDKVLEEIESTPSIHKKLLRLYKAGTYKDLNKDSLYRMQSVAKSLDLNLKISNDGKILLENKEDIETALKLLAEFYKEGKVFGRIYGTYAGKQISLN